MDTSASPTQKDDGASPIAHPGLEKAEDVGADVAVALAFAVRAVEIGAAVLIGLLVCPPLMILTFLVVAPLVIATVVVSLIAAVLAAPYLLVRHLRGHRVPHASVLGRRLRHATHAIVDLLPHRVARDARRESLL